MSTNTKGQAAAISSISQVKPDRPVQLPNRAASASETVKQTVFIDRRVHRKLKDISADNRISQQDIFMAALDLYLNEFDGSSIEKITGEVPKYKRAK